MARRCPSCLLQHRSDQGIVLPLVLVVSLLISAGLLALAARAWLGLSGSIRQSQARQAREIAEAGVARLVESMNREFAYLLIKDCLLYTSPSPRDATLSRMPSSA